MNGAVLIVSFVLASTLLSAQRTSVEEAITPAELSSMARVLPSAPLYSMKMFREEDKSRLPTSTPFRGNLLASLIPSKYRTRAIWELMAWEKRKPSLFRVAADTSAQMSSRYCYMFPQRIKPSPLLA
jgi:hypothetical protein